MSLEKLPDEAKNIMQKLTAIGYEERKLAEEFWKFHKSETIQSMSKQFPTEEIKLIYCAEQIYVAFVAGRQTNQFNVLVIGQEPIKAFSGQAPTRSVHTLVQRLVDNGDGQLIPSGDNEKKMVKQTGEKRAYQWLQMPALYNSVELSESENALYSEESTNWGQPLIDPNMKLLDLFRQNAQEINLWDVHIKGSRLLDGRRGKFSDPSDWRLIKVIVNRIYTGKNRDTGLPYVLYHVSAPGMPKELIIEGIPDPDHPDKVPNPVVIPGFLTANLDPQLDIYGEHSSLWALCTTRRQQKTGEPRLTFLNTVPIFLAPKKQ